MCVEDPRAYDGTKCGCVKCPNFEVCETWASPMYFSCCNGRCGRCDSTFAKNLVICNRPDDCSICLEHKSVLVAHPSGCGHATCIDCFKEAWWPEEAAENEDFDWGARADPQACALCRAHLCDANDNSWNIPRFEYNG